MASTTALGTLMACAWASSSYLSVGKSTVSRSRGSGAHLGERDISYTLPTETSVSQAALGARRSSQLRPAARQIDGRSAAVRRAE
jgi:hypothetical protein